MHRSYRIAIALATSLASVSPLFAQGSPLDGHWDGAIHAPFGDVAIAVDLASEAGRLRGEFSNASEQIQGLPLAAVIVDGRSLELKIRAGDANQALKGTLSADGRSIAGDFLVSVYGVPFELRRSGEARFQPAPASPAIAAMFEGEWRGELTIGDHSLPVVLTMANRGPDVATGTWWSDEAVRIPVAIATNGSRITIRSNVTRDSFTGTVAADGTRMSGTFTEGPLELPLSLQRTSR
jgi:hypothetical protein